MKNQMLQAVTSEMGKDWADAISYFSFSLTKQFGERADDIMQSAISKAYRCYDGRAGVKTFLKQVLRSTVSDSLKERAMDIPASLLGSLNSTAGDDDGASRELWEMTADDDSPVPDERAMFNEEMELNLASLNDALKFLNTKEKVVIELSFGLNGDSPIRQNKIAEILGLSPERIRQLRNSGLEKLKLEML